MIRPIVAYGDPVLKKVAREIDADYPDLSPLIDDMFETMYAAQGVGLAAPQIGLDIRLFVVDATPFAEDAEEVEDPQERKELEDLKDFKRVFINPIIVEEEGKEWPFEEGCLSIPKVREDVYRKPKVVIEYYNTDWELVEEELDGLAARVVQHEYDHIEGVLFTDLLSPLRRRFLKKKLAGISRGEVNVKYKMKFPQRKK